MPRLMKATAALAIALAGIGLSGPAQAQEKYLGEVFPVAFDFCPRNSLRADGSLIAIAQNTALFSLLGTTYGGNGQTTFALPDLRGRSPMHVGQGPGLSLYSQGQVSGAETTTLSISTMPAHNHAEQMRVSRVNGTATTPVGGYVARSLANIYDEVQPVGSETLAPDSIESNIVGGGQPFSTMQPGLVINFCVVTAGLYPSRN